jgi:alkylhydroperoxidase family enzyme
MRSGTRRTYASTAASRSSYACGSRSSTTAPTASTCTTRRRARPASPRAKLDTLTAWWETELHSEADQAALRYTEALTRVADTDRDAAFQRFHDALAEHFSPEEMLEIVAVVVNMNVWTRIKLAEGAMPGQAD